MIYLRLKFSGVESTEFQLEKEELLSSIMERETENLPFVRFNVLVNGHKIEEGFWSVTKIQPSDTVVISPRIQSGESGQLFKQFIILAATVTASALAPFTGGASIAIFTVAVSLATTLVMNALIPPLELDLGSGEGPETSQMYSISGQSNERKPYSVVPKVYGVHRIFPNIAATPYVELGVDKTTGETIQYLVAVYDFGLGSPAVTDLKIGDTPLTSENFEDFQYNFVDPNRPVTGDDFDNRLKPEFQVYKGDRQVTALSLALNTDGDVSTQNSAPNPHNYPQEIILDFVCPQGLYGYSSGGAMGDRGIQLKVEFALVGTNDWRGYNDATYADNWSSIGGKDFTDFKSAPAQILPTHPLFATYYHIQFETPGGSYNTANAGRSVANIRPNQRKLLVPTAVPNGASWTVGSKILYGSVYLGNIATVTPLGPTYPQFTELTLDRNITFPTNWGGFQALDDAFGITSQTTYGVVGGIYQPIFSYTGTFGLGSTITSSGHTVGTVTLRGDKAAALYTNVRFKPKTPGQYKVRVTRVAASGSYTSRVSDALTWGGLTTSFDNSPIKVPTRHVFLELKIRATDQLNGQVQNLSGVASQPLPVYDSTTQTWSRQITSNPAWIFCDLLTGEINKKAVDLSRLHLPSILEWAEFCAEVPTPPPGKEYKEPRFQTNFVLDYASTLQQVIQQIGAASQASLNIIDGKYGVLVDRLKTTPVQIFTPRNSSGFSSSRIYSNKPDAVKVTYIDPSLDWETTELVVYDNGFDEETAEEFDELTAFATTNYEQAWRFGRYMIAQNRLRQETISITVDFENLICTRGDYVQLTQDVMQVGGKPARVKLVAANVVTIDDKFDIDPDITYGYTYRSVTGEIKTSTLTPISSNEFELDGDIPEKGDLIVIGEVGKLVLDCIVKVISPNDDRSAQLTLVERANEIFDYESTDILPDYDPQFSPVVDPSMKPPRAVTNLTLTDVSWQCADTQSGYQYYAEIVWDVPVGSIYELFEVWHNDGSGYRIVGTTTGKYWKQTLNQARLGEEMGLKVVAVSASGKKLDLIAMPTVTFPTSVKSTPPSDVKGFGMAITQQVLQLAWQPVEDCDVFRYEIRYSPEVNDVWEATVPLQIVDRNVNSLSVQARTGIYLIKAVDFAGNKSVNASMALTTIPNLFDLNIIELLNDAPLFDGYTEQVQKLGDAVVLTERVAGDENTMEYYPDGYYLVKDIVDLGEIYSARLQSLIRADGYRFGELMSSWEHLADVEHLSSADTDEWDVITEYRATTEILSMASWEHLYDVEHLNEGLGQGFTEWRPIPTIGDATGRVFQFRIHLRSITPNVTPRLFDGTIKVDMPDRTENFENLVSSSSGLTNVVYSQKFAGPSPSPNVQITIDNGERGDYWRFENKSLEGFGIRFYDESNTQVSRNFDVAAKGYGRRHIVTI